MHWKKMMEDGYMSVGFNTPEEIAQAVWDSGFRPGVDK
jgi:hypothetical protein